MSGAIPLLPLHDFTVRTGKTLPFFTRCLPHQFRFGDPILDPPIDSAHTSNKTSVRKQHECHVPQQPEPTTNSTVQATLHFR